MRSKQVAARAARILVLGAVVAIGANLAACGGSGGISADLPPGPPTKAPPGNLVLYVAESQGNRINAYRLGTDGLLPSKPFDTIAVNNPRRLALGDGVLYATLDTRIVSMTLGPNGELPTVPTSLTVGADNLDPMDIKYRDGIIYVASRGLERVQSYVLASDGALPAVATGAGTGQYPADYGSLALDGDYIYSGSRQTQFIDMFILKNDGNVPLDAEKQDPQDSIALPDDIEIRDGFLYVTSASDKSIRAYRLMNNGFLPGDYNSRTKTEEYFSDMVLSGNILYTSAYDKGQIDLFTINPGGSLPEEPPFAQTQDDPQSFPSQMLLNDGILYVAQAGWNRVDAYVLNAQGVPPAYPSSSTRPASKNELLFPLGMALYNLN
jgi:6-phosphogluconolactonase (cycloisomerase 2 family)